jgi:hypothetical protein
MECAFPKELVHLIAINGFDDVEMDVVSFPSCQRSDKAMVPTRLVP